MANLYARIVVGVDDGEPSTRAVEFAVRLAHEHQGTLVLCHAVDWLQSVAGLESYALVDPNPIIDELREHGRALLTESAKLAEAFNVTAEQQLEEGNPIDTILKIAEDGGGSIIVMGTHGRRNLGRLIVGSTTEAVLRGSHLPVLVVRADDEPAPASRRVFDRLFVAIDDSGPADAAANLVLSLPPEDRHSLSVCSVVEVDRIFGSRAYYMAVKDYQFERAELVVQRFTESARAHGVPAIGHVRWGPTAETIIATALDEHADLIIIGSHGRRGLQRFFLGSVAEHVVRNSHSPVLIVRTAPRETVEVLVPSPALAAI